LALGFLTWFAPLPQPAQEQDWQTGLIITFAIAGLVYWEVPVAKILDRASGLKTHGLRQLNGS